MNVELANGASYGYTVNLDQGDERSPCPDETKLRPTALMAGLSLAEADQRLEAVFVVAGDNKEQLPSDVFFG